MKKIILSLPVFLFATTFCLASEPVVWTINSKADVLKGESRGVSIAADGTIGLAPRIEELFNTGQPFVWSDAIDAEGNVYLGTGTDGKVFRVDPQGKATVLADLDELNVSALALGSGGELYAGTSPDGKVYRIERSGKVTVFFEPKQKYIWSIALLSDGNLAIGTGENGKIYKVRSKDSKPEDSLLFDSGKAHIISLAVDKKGWLYAGTDPGGIVLRFSSDGKVFGVLDSPLREIHEIVTGVNGSVYVLALGESASSKAETETKAAESKSVSVQKGKNKPNAVPAPAKSRYDLSGAKSAVYRILPGGGSDIIWNSPSVSAFALYAHLTGNGVMVGTSDKGRIFSVRNDGRETLVLQTGEGQISSIKTFGNKLYATSSNQGKLFRFGGPRAGEASYESPVLDAGAGATWGRIWWRGSGGVVLQTRSGNTEKPDKTWSRWSDPYKNRDGEKVTSPRAAFLQWRAVLKDSEGGTRLHEVNLSYLPSNIAPEILSIRVLPANIGLARTQAVPVDPNIKTSGLDPADFGIVIPPAVPRKLYQRGAKSIIWKSEDRNGDDLEFAIWYREVGDSEFKLLKENAKVGFFTADGLAFADGRYVFKVVASDAPSNPVSNSLSGELVSEPFDIDNTAPSVNSLGTATDGKGNLMIRFEAVESSSFIKRAEYSVNGGEWSPVFPDDGISDSRREQYTITLRINSGGEHAVTLRVFDAVGNIGNARVLEKN